MHLKHPGLRVLYSRCSTSGSPCYLIFPYRARICVQYTEHPATWTGEILFWEGGEVLLDGEVLGSPCQARQAHGLIPSLGTLGLGWAPRGQICIRTLQPQSEKDLGMESRALCVPTMCHALCALRVSGWDFPVLLSLPFE